VFTYACIYIITYTRALIVLLYMLILSCDCLRAGGFDIVICYESNGWVRLLKGGFVIVVCKYESHRWVRFLMQTTESITVTGYSYQLLISAARG
jgi:hypothetical protein